MTTNVDILEISPMDAEARQLFRLLDEHNRLLCAPGHCHLTQPEEMVEGETLLLGAFVNQKLCGMGGLKFFKSYSEVTRMFVLPEHRRGQIASFILKALERVAAERNHQYLKLETSDAFLSAISLYRRYGFSTCAPFKNMGVASQNVFMEKRVFCK